MSSVPAPMTFLDAVQGHMERDQSSSADRPIRLAIVDPAYDSVTSFPAAPPACRVTFEGESTLSGKAYPLADGFVPRAGQRVYLLPQGHTWIVAGSVGGGSPRMPQVQVATASLTTTAGPSMSLPVTFPVAWPAGTTVRIPAMSIVGLPTGLNQVDLRATSILSSGFTLLVLKGDAAKADFVAGTNFTVHYAAYAYQQ